MEGWTNRLPGALAAIALPALAAPAALAATRAVDPPSLFHRQLPAVRSVSGIAVLLPSRIDAGVPARRVAGSASMRRGRYSLELEIGRSCHGAGACFVAAFIAERGGHPSGGAPVRLARGLKGRFHARACGASCAPPEIEWRQGGVLYTIQDSVPDDRHARTVLAALVDSSIRAGAR